MIVKLLTEHHLERLSLKEGCRASSESKLVKMSNCWKSNAAAQIVSICFSNQTGEQDVQMTNDKKVVSHYNDPKKAQSGKPVDQSKKKYSKTSKIRLLTFRNTR